MATHAVTFEVPERKLGCSDVKFEIKRDAEKFGTMTISNGSVVWFPRSLSGIRSLQPRINNLQTGDGS